MRDHNIANYSFEATLHWFQEIAIQVFHLSSVCFTEQVDEREKQAVEDLPLHPASIYI